VAGTINLARQAVLAGVKRFIFLSTIKVNGEKTEGIPFCSDDIPAPSDPYSVSKLEAEEALFSLGKETGMEVVVIRPPMVYGPVAKGNFSRLVWLVQNMILLPFGNIKNKRSLLYVDNLCDLIIHCIFHEKVPGQVITACDTYDLSTPELIHLIAKCLRTKCYLLPVPIFLLRLLGQLSGKKAEICRLTESLQIDNNEVERKIGWRPPVNVYEAFSRSIS
jgi:nucleoside-diphosphate-sugar epimerase